MTIAAPVQGFVFLADYGCVPSYGIPFSVPHHPALRLWATPVPRVQGLWTCTEWTTGTRIGMATAATPEEVIAAATRFLALKTPDDVQRAIRTAYMRIQLFLLSYENEEDDIPF